MDSINNLIKHFNDFPGIGPRQAKRFVYYLLTRDNAGLRELSSLIAKLKQSVDVCEECFRFFPRGAKKTELCSVCADPGRNRSLLMIVPRDTDLETIEKSDTYRGTYFVLGGSIPILEKNPEERVRLEPLLTYLKKRVAAKNPELREVILAMNFNPEGENTAETLVEILQPVITAANIKISNLGRGLSTGTEIEYTDSETLKNALKNRQ
ncbi:MAG: toprim domain-containing protein [bacterium]|nr:toprim domain-containing protein [bacterium]